MSKYIPTIGLEIHAELKTKSKMFCNCLNDPLEKKPNVNICPVCTGQPGALPVINKQAVNMVIKAGLALNCKINKYSWFERKNYFYPDLPKNYQVSQNQVPFCVNGKLENVRINNIHLEEDTGKLVHDRKTDASLVDFNRAGIPLMELVTEPDITSAQQAKKFAEELRLIFRYLGISDANMEKGQMRCEANISIRIKNEKLGTKVEIKNLNSFKAVERGVKYEIKRQEELLEAKEKVIQETRGWSEKKQRTFSQRSKELAEDYRYFPEPNLPPIRKTQKQIEKIKFEISELPSKRRKRFKKEYKISEGHIKLFANHKSLGDYFEQVISELKTYSNKSLERLTKLTANYLTTELKKYLPSLEEEHIKNLKITPENFAELVHLVNQNKVSSSGAQIVLKKMFETGADPSNIIKEEDLVQLSGKSELEKIIKQVIKENPQPVKDYKNGKEEAVQFLVGQVMKISSGKANPKIAAQLLKQAIDKT